jgi:hypothetical protein
LGQLRLNLGIVLTGAPALRKSTALSMMQRFAEGLPIAYGPTDTAGQRQGLMAAMTPKWQKGPSDDKDAIQQRISTLDDFANLDTDHVQAGVDSIEVGSSSEIYFVAKELGRLIASTTRELLDFFNDALDGNSIHYQLKSQNTRINKPMVNIIGATTPSSLGHMMPRGASEHGFLSRLVFVHSDVISKAVPIPTNWTKQQEAVKNGLHDRIRAAMEESHQSLTLTESATKTYTDLYGYQPPLADVRMQAYSGRRAEHMLKVSALLALMRGSGAHTEVIASDVRLAHVILCLTEMLMPRAYYGLETGVYSKVLCAAAELIEGSSNNEVDLAMMQSHAGHLADRESITRMMTSLSEQGKLTEAGVHKRQDKWTFNTTAQEKALALLTDGFGVDSQTFERTTPQPDEFRPWKVNKKDKFKVIEKGA